MKIDLFQFCGHSWVFQICWHIECSTFTASSFRIWNSSTGIPSRPLALFKFTCGTSYWLEGLETNILILFDKFVEYDILLSQLHPINAKARISFSTHHLQGKVITEIQTERNQFSAFEFQKRFQNRLWSSSERKQLTRTGMLISNFLAFDF